MHSGPPVFCPPISTPIHTDLLSRVWVSSREPPPPKLLGMEQSAAVLAWSSHKANAHTHNPPPPSGTLQCLPTGPCQGRVAQGLRA